MTDVIDIRMSTMISQLRRRSKQERRKEDLEYRATMNIKRQIDDARREVFKNMQLTKLMLFIIT